MGAIADLFQLCRSDPYFLRYSGIKKNSRFVLKISGFFRVFRENGANRGPQSGVWGIGSRLRVHPQPTVAFPSPLLSICIILGWAVWPDLARTSALVFYLFSNFPTRPAHHGGIVYYVLPVPFVFLLAGGTLQGESAETEKLPKALGST